VVLLVAGYGSDLTSASIVFSALQSALLVRDPTTSFAFFSYRGSEVRGCASVPTPYSPADTAQRLDISVAVFLTTLQALQSTCPADIAVVGHSLGGLIAFHALGDRPNTRVEAVMTVDSPLGGAPLASSMTCIQLGFCADGPVVHELGQLYDNWSASAAANASRQANLVAVDTRLSAWGNVSDCLYYIGLCSTVSDGAVASIDARATQWLGIARPVHKNYAYAPRVWNIPASHTAVLENAAAEMAADLLP
jgi:pimeloyl-ACP methyl ester carboxylesterase